MAVKDWLVTIGFLAAIVTSIALYETGAIHWSGKMAIVGLIFFSPSFFYKLYLLYDRRERLIDIYETSKIQMRIIKNNSALKKAHKAAEAKRNG